MKNAVKEYMYREEKNEFRAQAAGVAKYLTGI
jgi:hypothetical protein